MKISFTLLLSILLICGASHTLIAQNVTDSKGLKQGNWVKYHPDGKTMRYKGQFVNNKPVGKFVFYYETGEASMIMEHGTDGWADCKTYHLNGSIMAYGKYFKEKKEGIWWYFTIDKLVTAKDNFKNGQLEGVCYKYFPSKPEEPLKVLEEINYVNGLAQGAWKRYYLDGKIQVKGTYKDGQEFGECTWYAANGKPEVVGYFQHGVKNGHWRFYDKDGVETKVFYFHGVELKGKELEQYQNAVKNKPKKNE